MSFPCIIKKYLMSCFCRDLKLSLENHPSLLVTFHILEHFKQDIHFVFSGFGVVGKVLAAGETVGPAGVNIDLLDKDEKTVVQKTVTVKGKLCSLLIAQLLYNLGVERDCKTIFFLRFLKKELSMSEIT